MPHTTRTVLALLSVAAMGAMTALAATPAQAAVTNDTTVQTWYRQFLGRSSENAQTDGGRRYWVAQLDAGARPADVLWSITHSREYVEREIAGYYSDLLGRAPDAGASYWVEGAVAQRFPLEWVEQNLLASPEYFDHHYGRSLGPDWVVRDWYPKILGRCGPSDGETAYWVRRSQQVGQLGALRELWYSDEAVRYRVNGHYKDLLYRAADFSGLAYWYPEEVESDVNVAVLIGASPEFLESRVY